MNSREKLYEDYEEALFALLMDKVVELEGAVYIAENNRLKKSADFIISDDLNSKCLRIIDDAFSVRKNRERNVRTSKVLRVIFTVAAVISLLITTVYATMPEIRYAIINAIVRFADQETSFSFEPKDIDETLNDGISIGHYGIGFLPAGFELVNEGSEIYSDWRVFAANTSTIRIDVLTNEKFLSHSVDTEDAIVEEVIISSYSALVTEEGNVIRVVLFDKDHGAIINIRGENVDRTLMIQIATEIKFVG